MMKDKGPHETLRMPDCIARQTSHNLIEVACKCRRHGSLCKKPEVQPSSLITAPRPNKLQHTINSGTGYSCLYNIVHFKYFVCGPGRGPRRRTWDCDELTRPVDLEPMLRRPIETEASIRTLPNTGYLLSLATGGLLYAVLRPIE
jgi:hypothetical protein